MIGVYSGHTRWASGHDRVETVALSSLSVAKPALTLASSWRHRGSPGSYRGITGCRRGNSVPRPCLFLGSTGRGISAGVDTITHGLGTASARNHKGMSRECTGAAPEVRRHICPALTGSNFWLLPKTGAGQILTPGYTRRRHGDSKHEKGSTREAQGHSRSAPIRAGFLSWARPGARSAVV